MLNSFKFLLLLSVLVIFAVNGLSCRKNPATKKTVLTVWLVGYKKTNFERYASLFTTRNKGVKVELVEKQRHSLEEELMEALASKQGPDLVIVDNDFLTKHKEVFLPCVKKITSKKTYYCEVEVLRENYIPATQSLIWGDKIYGYPLKFTTPVVIYNTRLFYEAKRKHQLPPRIPYYWDDFVKLVQKLTVKQGTKIIRAGLALGTGKNIPSAPGIFYSLLLQNGTVISSAESEPLARFHLPITTETGALVYPGAKALEFYSSFSYPKSKNYTFNLSFGEAWEEFAREKVVMIIDYPERLDDIRYLNPNIRVNFALFPQIRDTENPTVYGKLYVFAITNNTENPVKAWDLARFLANRIPDSYVKKPYRERDWRQARGQREILLTQANFAQVIYKGEIPEEFDRVIREMLDWVATGKVKPKPAIEKAADQINKLAKSAD
ncbi:extracellular solute-binding protein [bacterium]|nr:extracellular solute-binding protein [bacterium]